MTETTDPTAAIEVWARMLCAADVHVHGEDHPTWQQLVGEPGSRIRDDYRKAAAWLLPRLTVSAKLPAPADRAAILREAAERVTGHAADHFPDEYDDYADQLAAELRRMADEAPGPDRCSACRYIPCDNCRPAAAGSAVAGHTGDEAAHREPVNPCTRGNNFCGQHGYDCPPDEPAAGLPAGGAPHTKEADNPRSVCVCGHTRAEHLTVSGRLLCDACDPDSTSNLVCRGFDAL